MVEPVAKFEMSKVQSRARTYVTEEGPGCPWAKFARLCAYHQLQILVFENFDSESPFLRELHASFEDCDILTFLA